MRPVIILIILYNIIVAGGLLTLPSLKIEVGGKGCILYVIGMPKRPIRYDAEPVKTLIR